MDRTPQTNSSIPGKQLDTIRHFAKLVNRSIRERVRAALLMTLDQPIADGQEAEAMTRVKTLARDHEEGKLVNCNFSAYPSRRGSGLRARSLQAMFRECSIA